MVHAIKDVIVGSNKGWLGEKGMRVDIGAMTDEQIQPRGNGGWGRGCLMSEDHPGFDLERRRS